MVSTNRNTLALASRITSVRYPNGYDTTSPATPLISQRSTLLLQPARPLISQSTFMPYVTGNLAPVDAQAETTVSHVVLFSDVELSATPAAPPLISRSTLLPQPARPLISQSTFVSYVTGNLAPIDAKAETTVSHVVLFSDVELSTTRPQNQLCCPHIH